MPDRTRLTIMQMNDSHSYLEAHPELFWSGGGVRYAIAGGYARIATLLRQMRQERSGQVLAFDCGDTFHGTYPAVATQGEALIPILNALNFEAMTVHWDFGYGPTQLKTLAAQLSYPILAINCYEKDTNRLFFDPYTIREMRGVRVGIIGIAATIVDKTMPEHFHKGLYLTLGNEELPGYIAKLRQEERVDLVLVLSHLGFPQDVKMAAEVEGVDVWLSGHTHNRLYQPVRINDTLMIQSGYDGSFVGRLDVEIEGGRVINWTHELLVVAEDIVPDPEVQHLVDQALSPYREMLREVVGQTATALNRNTILEATMDNFLLQGLLHETGAQIAFSNGWRYGAPVLPGQVTMNDLYNIIPVNPPVSTVELTGEEIRDMLEKNLENTFAPDPYRQMGGYVKRCMGLKVYIKIENPAGHRIQELFIQGERARPDHRYQATFVTTQGVPATYGTHRRNLEVRAVEALRHYLAARSPITAELHGAVVAI